MSAKACSLSPPELWIDWITLIRLPLGESRFVRASPQATLPSTTPTGRSFFARDTISRDPLLGKIFFALQIGSVMLARSCVVVILKALISRTLLIVWEEAS